MLQSINNAGVRDMVNTTNGSIAKLETPQSIAANGGGTITLRDPQAAAHYAILWAGDTTYLSHFNDIDKMITTLKTQWANTSFNIFVLYGNGMDETINGSYDNVSLPASWNQGGCNVKDASRINLINTVGSLALILRPEDQFLFYASDHGGQQVSMLGSLLNHTFNTRFHLADGVLQGLHLQLSNVSALFSPSLTIDYSRLTAAATVTLDDHLLGSLDPTKTTMEFQVPEWILLADNSIDINNPGSPFTIQDLTFDTGGIDMITPGATPVPPTGLLLGSGLLGLAGWRRFRKG